MQTLVQYEYLDRDVILSGVVDTIVKESPVLGILPQKTIQGNAYKYSVELSLPTVSWLTIGDLITENTGTFEQRSTDIYTLIGDADTDKTAIQLNATQNPEAIDVAMKAKAMAHAWELNFIMGQTTTASSTKQFKGLLRMIAELESSSTTDLDGSTTPGAGNNTQVIAVNAASGALTMAYMDALIDQVKPGKPDLLLMSRVTRRKLNTLMRATGSTGSGVQLAEIGGFGLKVPTYDGIPILVSDWLPDNIQDGASSVLDIANFNQATARASGYDNTVIFALQLGDDKLCGLNAGEITHERELFIENKDVIRNRFKWLCGAALFKKYSAAVLININPDS